MPKRLTILAALALSTVLSTAALADSAPDADTVVATVNGEDITIGHMIIARATLPEQYQQVPADVLYNAILDQLIQQTALVQSRKGDVPRVVELSLENERRSMLAERDTTDRYLASYLNKRVGETFEGKVSGIARFGIFVKLDETGADGLVPMRELGREYFNYNEERGVLVGSDTGREIRLGLRVKVKLAEAAPVTGGIALELLEMDGEAVKQGRGGPRGRGKPPKRAKGKARAKAAKTKRKIERKRK